MDSLNDVYYNDNFQNKKIIFKELNLKFFSDTKSFNLDQLNSKILYNDRKINEIIANAFIGEIPFKINYKNDQLIYYRKNIGLNANLKNLFNKKKDLNFHLIVNLYFQVLTKYLHLLKLKLMKIIY